MPLKYDDRNHNLRLFAFPDKQIDLKMPPVSSLDILNLVAIDQKVYIAARDGKVYGFEDNHLKKSFQPFNSQLHLLGRSSYEPNGVLVAMGVDSEGANKNCTVKFYTADVLEKDPSEISKALFTFTFTFCLYCGLYFMVFLGWVYIYVWSCLSFKKQGQRTLNRFTWGRSGTRLQAHTLPWM